MTGGSPEAVPSGASGEREADQAAWWLALYSFARSGAPGEELAGGVARAGSAQAFLTGEVGELEQGRLVNWDWVARMRAALAETETDIVPFLSPDYPPGLRRLSHPPLMLFCRGRRDLLRERTAVAIVGTRRATLTGRGLARELGFALARSGVLVVSGLAEGIDAAAHQGALEAGGDTLAVLGTGCDVAYPRRNRELQGEIAGRGLLLGEFPPGSPPRAAHFPQRNRLVSALSGGVVVVEGGRRSGALITAGYAARQGKKVMAVPGVPGSPESAGPNWLIKTKGALLVEHAEDVARHLGAGAPPELELEEPPPRGEPGGDRLPGPRRPAGVSLLENLGRRGLSPDVLARETGRPVSWVVAELLRLELLGRVESISGGTLWRARDDARRGGRT